jgi:outer membrane protein assembly factor BamB
MKPNQAVKAALAVALPVSLGLALHAQGRGGEWTTSAFDAQRSGWVRTDPRISTKTMLKPGEFGAFKFLWKLKLEHDPKAATVLTAPVLLDRIIGFRGFKSIAFVATQSETVHAVDYDLGTTLWKYHINYHASPPPVTLGTADCPAGLTAALSRPTAFAPPAAGGRGGGGGGGATSGGGVGEPGKGSITLARPGRGRGGAAAAGGATAGAPGAQPGPASPPRPQGAEAGSAAAAAGNQPGGLPGGARQGGPAGGGAVSGFQPGGDAAYVVGSDGFLHALNVQNGWDNMTPALFIPSNTRATGLIVASSDAGAVAYAATTHRCGSQPDAVWAMDLADAKKPVTAFKVGEATIAGAAGPSIGRDGTVYIATAAGTAAESSSVFALEPKTLKPKGAAKVAGAAFSTSPLVFTWKDKDAVLVAGGGRIYAFDPASLAGGPVAGGPGAGGPIAMSPAFPADAEIGSLASWIDAGGVRWVAASAPRGIVTFTLTEEGGKPVFHAGWTSPDIASPLPPLVVNGVLFAASIGTRAVPGVLYALDAATGKPLWTSGRAITSTIRGGLSAGAGTVFVPGSDSTLYAFGFEIEK